MYHLLLNVYVSDPDVDFEATGVKSYSFIFHNTLSSNMFFCG